MHDKNANRAGAILVSAALAVALATASAGATDHHDHAAHQHQTAGDEHAAHRAQMSGQSEASVSRHAYPVPDIQLQDSNGRTVHLRELLDAERPVALNFIFTSCTTICPVMTATMLQTQHHLADASMRPEFISITIDPEFDDAGTLRDYAARYGAKWTFLTGSRADVTLVLKAFDAYRGAKANHIAVTLLRAPNQTEWTRVEGLASADQLAQLWRDLSS